MQILVVVANTPVRPWRTDVEKASMGTAVGHGSVDPKVVIEKNLKKEPRPFTGAWEKKFFFSDRKGSGLIFPHLDAVVKGVLTVLNGR